MRIFREEDERRIYELELARAWKRSGLIDQERLALVEAQGEPPALAAIAIRLLFFGFAALALVSIAVYAGWKLHDETSVGTFLLLFSVPCWILGEWLIRRYRLYRFGVEEALVTGAGVQFCLGLNILALRNSPSLNAHTLLVWSLPATAICIAAYLRFGYLYAGFGAILSIACLVFGLNWSTNLSRLLLASLYGVLLYASTARREVPDYEKGRWDMLQAGLFLGIYLILNLQLSGLGDWRGRWSPAAAPGSGAFYWFTFAAIWILPACWLYWGVLARRRAAIDSGCVAALITLITNKPYLGMERHVWDPAILGALMMGLAIWLSRWLNSGPDKKRNGFTARQLIQERDDGLAAAQLLGAAVAGSTAAPAHATNPEIFRGRGGKSGGAGAGGGY